MSPMVSWSWCINNALAIVVHWFCVSHCHEGVRVEDSTHRSINRVSSGCDVRR